MATTTALNLYLPAGTDYVSVDRDLSANYQKIDDAFASLFLLKHYSTTISSFATGSKAYKGSDLGVTEIAGYEPLAIRNIFASSAYGIMRGYYLDRLLSSESSAIYFRNISSAAQSNVTIDLDVLWVKSGYIDDQREGT